MFKDIFNLFKLLYKLLGIDGTLIYINEYDNGIGEGLRFTFEWLKNDSILRYRIIIPVEMMETMDNADILARYIVNRVKNELEQKEKTE